jgi:hypothetical protein
MATAASRRISQILLMKSSCRCQPHGLETVENTLPMMLTTALPSGTMLF